MCVNVKRKCYTYKITNLKPLCGMGTTVRDSKSVTLRLTDNPVTLAQINALKEMLPERAVITHNAVCNGCCDTFCDVCWGSPCVCPLSIDVVDGTIELHNPS